jgi:mannose-6-phosphate isomerase-like protein (cupin superfamily)
MDLRASSSTRSFRPDGEQFRWDDVDVLIYKDEGSAPFRDVTRQVLFEEAEQGCQLRYFEVAPGGHTTLERHVHVHAVAIVNGRGSVLIGHEVRDVAAFDLCSVPSLTWHQFRAADDAPLGFLCLVNSERDRPQLPTDAELADLRRNPAVAAFIRTNQ